MFFVRNAHPITPIMDNVYGPLSEVGNQGTKLRVQKENDPGKVKVWVQYKIDGLWVHPARTAQNLATKISGGMKWVSERTYFTTNLWKTGSETFDHGSGSLDKTVTALKTANDTLEQFIDLVGEDIDRMSTSDLSAEERIQVLNRQKGRLSQVVVNGKERDFDEVLNAAGSGTHAIYQSYMELKKDKPKEELNKLRDELSHIEKLSIKAQLYCAIARNSIQLIEFDEAYKARLT